MFPFFESIRCLNGRIYQIAAHDTRVHATRTAHYGEVRPLRLRKHIIIPPAFRSGSYKCRVSYGRGIGPITITPYMPRPIHSLAAVDTLMEYSYKYEDRCQIEMLRAAYSDYDDVLMIKDGQITDTSYANVALLQDGRWYTPDQPLLPGTRRATLISKGRLYPRRLHIDQLVSYSHVCLINALLPLGRVVLPTSAITRYDKS